MNNRDKNKATTNSDTNNFDGGFARSKALLEQNGGKTIGKKHALSNIEQEKASKKPRVRAFDFNDVLQLVQKMRPQQGRMTTEAQNWLQILTMRLRQHTMTITAQDCRQILMLIQRPFALART